MSEKNEILIFGAGALSLGFLGPELCKDYNLTLVDIGTKEELLSHLRREKRYFVNVSGPSLKSLEVSNINGLNLEISAEKEEVVEKIASAKIIFTAVGTGNLEKLVPLLCKGLTNRFKKNEEKLYILCCENGINIAGRLESSLQTSLKKSLPSNIKTGDTVMGRMCRTEEMAVNTDAVRPVFKDSGWAVIAEPFFGIPVKKGLVSGDISFSDAFQIKEDKVFDALEDVKFFAHNGGHAFLAYLGCLKEYKHYPELSRDKHLMGLAARMLDEEIGSALISKHKGAINRNDYSNYITALLRRMTCSSFNDPIERGIRGSLEKLHPDERLISGANFILSRGIIPEIYSLTIAAAIIININNKNLSGSLDEILVNYCSLDQERDAQLFNLIKKSYDSLGKRSVSRK